MSRILGRVNHAWAPSGVEGVDACPCGAARRGVGQRRAGGAANFEHRAPGSTEWGRRATSCTRVTPLDRRDGVRGGARAFASPDELYLALDDRYRLVMGACVLTQPPLSMAYVGAVLGVSRQRVEQLVAAVYAMALPEAGLPPRAGTGGGDHWKNAASFRAKAWARLGSAERREAPALEYLRVRLLTALSTRTVGVRWCCRCAAHKGVGEFYASTVRSRQSDVCKACRAAYYSDRYAAGRWGVCAECLDAEAAPGGVRCASCLAAAEERWLRSRRHGPAVVHAGAVLRRGVPDGVEGLDR